MLNTKVVHCQKSSYDIYIGRPSKWGNPFFINEQYGRGYVVDKYRLWLNTQPELLKDIPSLKDKTLGCFCAPQACHGDVLAELASSKWIKNWFSNMNRMTPLVEDGIVYTSVENYYQAMKVHPSLRSKIAIMSPFEAKKEIRNVNSYPWLSTWSKEVSLQVMEKAIRHKFTQDTKWRRYLEMTENWEITEWNNWGDYFWGKSLDGKGENHLGKIIMKVRDEILS